MRGKKRIQPGYHASRGWFYAPIQKVIKKWDPKFGRLATNETFHLVRRVMEDGQGRLVIDIKNRAHRQFVCELLSALDKLHAKENICGWVVKVWPRRADTYRKRFLLTYSEIREKIIAMSGTEFSEDALKQAARKLRMIASEEQKNLDEQSAVLGDGNNGPSKRVIKNKK